LSKTGFLDAHPWRTGHRTVPIHKLARANAVPQVVHFSRAKVVHFCVAARIRQQIGKFELRGSADAATLPMVGDDPENLLLRGGRAHRRFPLFISS
jgi:hypothetical protein